MLRLLCLVPECCPLYLQSNSRIWDVWGSVFTVFSREGDLFKVSVIRIDKGVHGTGSPLGLSVNSIINRTIQKNFTFFFFLLQRWCMPWDHFRYFRCSEMSWKVPVNNISDKKCTKKFHGNSLQQSCHSNLMTNTLLTYLSDNISLWLF